MNTLIFIATIMDPQDKHEFMEFSLNKIYGEELGGRLFNNAKVDMYLLYNDYMNMYA